MVHVITSFSLIFLFKKSQAKPGYHMKNHYGSVKYEVSEIEVLFTLLTLYSRYTTFICFLYSLSQGNSVRK